MKLRRKPLVHEAHVFDGTEKSVAEARLLLENQRGPSRLTFTKPIDGAPGWLTVASKNGNVGYAAKVGDYLVKESNTGEIIPMSPDVVAANFDVLPDK